MWKHKDNPKKHFVGKYEREYSSKERVFILSDGKRRITFESWQLAKKAGWSKVK